MSMSIPKFLNPYLASYDLSKIDAVRHKELIITEVLNKGDFKALSWLCKTYSKRDLVKVIKNPIRGVWLKDVLLYWMKIFDIELPGKVFRQALLDLNPYNEKVTPRGFK